MSWYGDAANWAGNKAQQGAGYVRGATDEMGITQPPPPDLSQGPDAQRERDFAHDVMSRYANYRPQTAPTIDSADSNADRDRYSAAIDLLNGGAAGTAPSAAAAGMRGGLDTSIAQRMNAPGDLDHVLRGVATGGGNVVDQAGQARADELGHARQALFEAAQGLRGQDINREQFAGNLAQRQNQINNTYQLGLGGLAESSLLDPYLAALQNQERQERAAAANQTGLGGIISTGAKLL